MVQGNIIESQLKDLKVESVMHYQNGKDALIQIRNFLPDLVISAMYLPDMTGIDLVHALRDDPKLETIPFMLVSSETSFSMLDPIRQAGVIAILPKPFKPGDIQKALYATVEHINPDKDALVDIDLESLTTLIVDDSPLARKHITRVLNSLDITNITEAENGKDAVQMIEENFYDLIVTDYNMPEMDGEELIRHIRERSSQQSVPILMVTSEGDQSRISAVQQAGVSGICDKPFETLTIKTLIRQMMTEF